MEFRENDIAKLDLVPFRLPSADAISPIPPFNVPGTLNSLVVSPRCIYIHKYSFSPIDRKPDLVTIAK